MYILDYAAVLLVMRITSLTLEVIISSIHLFQLTTLISKVALIIATIGVRLFRAKTKGIGYVEGKDWFVLIGLSFFFALALMTLFELCSRIDDVPSIVMPTAIGLTFSSLLIFWLMTMLAKQGRIATENTVIKQQLRSQEECNIALLENYLEQDAVLYALKGHIDSTQTMIETGNIQDAAAEIGLLQKEVYLGIFEIRTGNQTIDAILNAKAKQAKRRGIAFRVVESNLSTLQLDPIHLATILSNTIDNAMEACVKVADDNRRIDLKIEKERDLLIYSIINPIISKLNISNNMIQTTKEDTQGWGLQRAASSVRQLGGDYEIDCDANHFQFTAIINLDETAEMVPTGGKIGTNAIPDTI
jgi:signal transduction histidine kinase